MRYHSELVDGFKVFAVAGTNTVSFGITATPAALTGLLGFAVERYDPKDNEKYIMPGFKVFGSVIPNPGPDTIVSTWDHPVQSLVWDDFTAKPGYEYTYTFYPLRGKPKNLDRSATPIVIKVKTEPLYGETQDVFFNRGVASSQAYSRKFGTQPLSKLDSATFDAAIKWLTRDLLDAIKKFIGSAAPGDEILGCFYEFHYPPVIEALKEAIDRGVNVRLIVDGKDNSFTDNKGKFHEAFPSVANRKAVNGVLPVSVIKWREARPNVIQHNKFMVLRRGGKPIEVWTGSTNISDGGFAGQTNVGQWIRDKGLAAEFEAYWNLLHADPGSHNDGDKAADDKLKADVAALRNVPLTFDTTPALGSVFSPRAGAKVLNYYFDLVAGSKGSGFITLAFGINADLKTQLVTHTSNSPVTFMLLEKRDQAPKLKDPTKPPKNPFVPLTAKNNVYEAWGASIKNPVYTFVRKETTAGLLGLNSHVIYVHSKFLLRDPLSEDPVVVTGSANFSGASTNDNDENMVVVRGDKRVADIYFTEFNRLFNHYYFRSMQEVFGGNAATNDPGASLLLKETAVEWTVKYAPGTLKSKRLSMYANMTGSVKL